MEERKQHIIAHRVVTQSKALHHSEKTVEKNQLFIVNKKGFLQSLTDDGIKQTLLDSAEATVFWSDMWNAPMVHNNGASWKKS